MRFIHQAQDEMREGVIHHRVIHHEADWEPTPDIIDRVSAGTAICVEGRLIARTRYCAAHIFRDKEGVIAWAAARKKPFVMTQLLIPREQRISGCSCEARGKAMLDLGRQAEAIDLEIPMLLHSHGGMSAGFLSPTDVETTSQLETDGVCRQSAQYQAVPGSWVSPVTEVQAGPEKQWEATFPGLAGIRLSLGTTCPDVAPKDIRLQLQHETLTTVSCFGVVNARGDLFLPTLRRSTCSLCGTIISEELEGDDVEVHVIGPMDLQEEDKTTLDRQRREMNFQEEGWRTYGLWEDASPLPSTLCADYQVWRQGTLVGNIPAALMEQIVSLIPQVSKCFGWDDDPVVAQLPGENVQEN